MSAQTKMIVYNLIFLFLFIAAYSFNRSLMYIATLTAVIFIFTIKDIHYCVGELFFLLPFSATMIISPGTTSLFMLPKLVVIAVFLYKSKGRIKQTVLLSGGILLVYALASSLLIGNLPITRIVNLLLWFFIAYVIFDTTKTGITVEGTSFVYGVILTGIIGLVKDYIPNLSSELVKAQYLNESTGVFVERFAGLWNDPNGYTVFIICSLFVIQWELINNKINFGGFVIKAVVLSVFGLLTLSKSCILMMLLFWICFILFQRNVSKMMKMVMIVLFFACLVLLYLRYSDMVQEVIYRFTKGNSGSSISLAALTTYRSLIWRDYLVAIWSGNFLFGSGIDAPLIGGYACHNSYIQLLYEWGIIGGMVYIGTWIGVLKQSPKTLHRRNWFPFLFLIVLVLFISCVYIEFLYLLLPLSLRVGEGVAYVEIKPNNMAYSVRLASR